MASLSPLPPADAPMGESVLSHDWGATPLGPRRSWPPSLAFAVGLCLRSPLATALYWGPERILVHNDAWARLVGGGTALGLPAPEVASSLWPVAAPLVERVESRAEGAFVQEQPVRLLRDGAEEETYWNCHLVPIVDERGKVAGLLNQANEVTKTVAVERRLSFQVQLADRLRGVQDPEEAKQAAVESLGSYLGAARVGYAEIDEAQGLAFVQRDWTRDPGVPSLAGQRTEIASFGEEALGLFRAGQMLAIPDIRQLPMGSADRTAAWEAAGVRALITVPLVREGALKALLYVHEPQPRAWKRSDAAIARDVAERSWAAVERARAEQSLADSEDHYRHTVELNPQVTWTAHADGQLNRVSNRWNVWTGTSGLGGSWIEAIHPEDRQPSLDAWSLSVANGESYDIEHRVRMRDGSYRWARSRAFPRRRDDGEICLWYGSTEDIHERKVAEEHQRLLINELNHRVKNTLASVQGIAFQTLRGDVPLAEARARFEARLMALSGAHNLLTEENWGGASLERVVSDSVEHLAGESARFDVEGEPLRLAPRAALALAMALHELGTNAAKYGALSVEGGRVTIAWSQTGDRLRLEWRESGGPPVEPRGRRGFGSRLIERGLAADLGGAAALHFDPSGLRCEIEASLAAVRAPERALG
ncbi:MAG TPA: HWE histidine kinase domain-containing protein [Allosphingosinicella sp.]|nr:HWE histidine kinase domain-containing protein [Allosphingosinicella sp.]